MPSHYESLEISPDATLDEIKTAYRKKAIEFHPDRNPNDPIAEEHFKNAVLAYEVLRDPEKRKLYDVGLSLGTDDFDPTLLDPTILEPEVFVNTFVGLFGAFLDEKIPGFRETVNKAAKKARSKDKNGARRKQTKCKICDDRGRIKLKQGNFIVYAACKACRQTKAS